jgi:transcriptional regulator with XRE-family HTH domain
MFLFFLLFAILIVIFIFLIYKIHGTNMATVKMLSDVIKDQIKVKMTKAGYNPNSLALNAGLNSSAIRMLYNGAIRSPSIETLYKLAETLNCSLDELAGRKQYTDIEDKREFNWEGDVYNEITEIINSYIKEKNYKTTLNQTLSFIKEAYIFALDKNNSKVDERFVKWIVDRNMDKTLPLI